MNTCKSSINGNEIILYATIASIIISKDLNSQELNLLGNFFQAVGQNLEVLSAYLNNPNSLNNSECL